MAIFIIRLYKNILQFIPQAKEAAKQTTNLHQLARFRMRGVRRYTQTMAIQFCTAALKHFRHNYRSSAPPLTYINCVSVHMDQAASATKQ